MINKTPIISELAGVKVKRCPYCSRQIKKQQQLCFMCKRIKKYLRDWGFKQWAIERLFKEGNYE